MSIAIWGLVAALNLPVLVLFGKLLFGNWRGFWEACESLFVLDLSAALTGEEQEVRGSKWLLLVYLLFAIFSFLIEYYLIAHYGFGIADPWQG
ncbi:MAG TPA: hypothetical protein VL096_15085 [Pirellulaceae bacterium]|nr:hypothetical protein [Pirellulaceae bacterium]